jgi:hypothetical protein
MLDFRSGSKNQGCAVMGARQTIEWGQCVPVRRHVGEVLVKWGGVLLALGGEQTFQ